jgi:hypothetical protein
MAIIVRPTIAVALSQNPEPASSFETAFSFIPELHFY